MRRLLNRHERRGRLLPVNRIVELLPHNLQGKGLRIIRCTQMHQIQPCGLRRQVEGGRLLVPLL